MFTQKLLNGPKNFATNSQVRHIPKQMSKKFGVPCS